MRNKNIQIIDIGKKPYKQALSIQESYFNQIIDLKRANRRQATKVLTKNFLLWVEHPPVITLGKSGKRENLLLNENQMKKKE